MRKLKFKRYVLSLSFGNYLKGDGGTDKAIAEHQRIVNNGQISYIQIAPVGKGAAENKNVYYTVVIDGVYEKILPEADLKLWLNSLEGDNCYLDSIFIHHLIKFKMSFIEELCAVTQAPIIFYLHDYYSICPQYELLNNHGKYCGEGRVSEQKCSDCIYYDEAKTHRNRIEKFLRDFSEQIMIVSPSDAALRIWLESYGDIKVQHKVIPHQIMRGTYKKSEQTSDAIRVAYIGKMVPPKGSKLWESFMEGVINQGTDGYECYYLGVSDNKYPNVIKERVFVTPENPDAMVQALRKLNIQIVFLWSIWPETYSYVYYEALAAGCFVITSSVSGNIASKVIEEKNGKVFESEEEALDYLKDIDKVREDIQKVSITGPENLEVNTNILSLLSRENHVFSFKVKKQYLLSIKAKIIDVLYKRKNMKGVC